MAVTSSFKRNHSTTTTTLYMSFLTATFTGTYVTGGFTWNPLVIFAGLGSSPLAAGTPLRAEFDSPLGYKYITTFSTDGSVATTKIFSAANTEFAAGAVPDATVPVVLTQRKVG